MFFFWFIWRGHSYNTKTTVARDRFEKFDFFSVFFPIPNDKNI